MTIFILHIINSPIFPNNDIFVANCHNLVINNSKYMTTTNINFIMAAVSTEMLPAYIANTLRPRVSYTTMEYNDSRHISNSNNTYTIIIIVSIYNSLFSVTTVCIVQSDDLFAFRSPLIHTPIII